MQATKLKVRNVKVRQDLLLTLHTIEEYVEHGCYEINQGELDKLKEEVDELYNIVMKLQLKDFEDKREKTNISYSIYSVEVGDIIQVYWWDGDVNEYKIANSDRGGIITPEIHGAGEDWEWMIEEVDSIEDLREYIRDIIYEEQTIKHIEIFKHRQD